MHLFKIGSHYFFHKENYNQKEFELIVDEARHMYDERDCFDCGVCNGFEDGCACVNMGVVFGNLVRFYGFRRAYLNGCVHING